MQMFEVFEKGWIFAVNTRLISPEREVETSRSNATINKKAVEIISPKKLNGFAALKRNLFLTCRTFGTRLDMLNAWFVTDDRVEMLEQEVQSLLRAWAEKGKEFSEAFPGYVDEHVAANPDDARLIRRVAPSAQTVQEAIRGAYCCFRLHEDHVRSMGMEREVMSLAQQCAYEIAREVIESTGKGSRYTRDTVAVLARVAKKATSFGFLHPALAAIEPAVQKLIASLPPVVQTFKGDSALLIGALVGFLSNDKRLLAEGERLGESMFAEKDMDLDLLSNRVASVAAVAPTPPTVAVVDLSPPAPAAVTEETEADMDDGDLELPAGLLGRVESLSGVELF